VILTSTKKILRTLTNAVVLSAAVLPGCAHFGVAPGMTLRVQTAKVTSVIVDISQAGAFVGSSWTNEMTPGIVKHTPDAFAKYGIKADVLTLTNEGSIRELPRNSYVLVLSAKSHTYNSKVGNNYFFEVTFLSPQGAKLWHSTAGYLASPFMNYDESARYFSEMLAKHLNDAGMFSGNGDADDAKPSPTRLSKEAQIALEQYKTKPYPRAFVVEDGGHFFSAHGTLNNDRATPYVIAFKKCTDAGYTTCHLVAADDEVFD